MASSHVPAAEPFLPPAPTINDLPDDLLARCLEPLSQEERWKGAALVSKRWQQACLAPALLRTVSAQTGHKLGSDPLPRLRALLQFLQQHAAHVRSLKLEASIYGTDAAALVAACLAACSTAGSLEGLAVRTSERETTVGWLCGLTQLRSLDLDYERAPLVLPAGFSRLAALTDASLFGLTVVFEGALPPNLTRLFLGDEDSPQLPAQLTALVKLQTLDLAYYSLDESWLGLAAESRLHQLACLPALRTLVWQTGAPLPAGVSALTQLQALKLSNVEHYENKLNFTALQSALPHLQGLTALSLYFGFGLPGEEFTPLARLPRLQRLQLLGTPDPLPPGPWVASLRWLCVPWGLLAASADVLWGGPQLEYVASYGMPEEGEEGSAKRRAWAAAFALLGGLPALRCF